MTAATVRLHGRLYRARAVAEAVRLVGESWSGALERRREGDYHVVEASGGSPGEARDVLGEVGDAALVITVEQDRR